MSLTRAGRTFAALAASALLLGTAPGAMAAQSTVSGKISPIRFEPNAPKQTARLIPQLTVGFSIAKEDGQSTTLRRAVLRLPPSAMLDGRSFPSCSPGPINAGSTFNVCPLGSALATGRFVADVPGAGLFNVPGRVIVFNGRGGKSMTVHFHADSPAISLAFTAPLRRAHGRFGSELTMPFPSSLQELPAASPSSIEVPVTGSLLEIKRVTLTFMAFWRDRSYVQTRECPRSGRAPIAGAFDFLRESGPSQATGFLDCRRTPRAPR